jgi:hypothetical protein
MAAVLIVTFVPSMAPFTGRDFRFGFNDILDTFYPTKGGEALYRQDQLMPKLQRGEYDALIMTSCMSTFIQPLLYATNIPV